MKTKIMIMMLLCMSFAFLGCNELIQEAADPNSGLNVGVDAVSNIIPAVAAGAGAAAAAGLPWAAIVLLATNVVSVVIGTYKNHRKNIVIDEQDELYINTKVTTRAIIEAIEDVGGMTVSGGSETVGDVIKGKVEEKLKDKDYYLIGKAIITALKGE